MLVADNAGTELDQITLDKLWDAGKTHAVVLSEVETEALLDKFLSHDPQGLVALQLPKLPYAWNFKRLLQTPSLAMDLQHVAIQKCCKELFLSLFQFEKIESLKLVDPEFPTEAWSGLKTEEKIPLCSSLKSLSLKIKEMAHIRALSENLAVFPDLEEVRIICTAEDNSQFISVLDMETLLQATRQLRKLRSIELHSLAKGASSRFVTDLPDSVQCLALPAAGLRAEEIATLVSSLELKNSLQKLNLCGHYNVDTGKAFKRWLANPNCSLRYLELEGYWANEAPLAFVQGLSGNRSLDTLIIKMTSPGGSDSTDGGETDTGEDSVESDKQGQDSPRGNSVVWSIVEAVPKMGALTSLHLSDAGLSPDNIAAIGIAALDSSTLLMLSLKENKWDVDAAKRFSEALEKNNVLIEVILPSRGGAQFRKKIQLRLEKNRQGSVEASAGMNDLVAVSSTSTTSTSTAPTASIWSGSTPSTAMTPAEKSTENS